MYCTERKIFYDGLCELAEDLLEKNTTESKKFLSTMLKSLSKTPYATLTFIYMFQYIHLTSTKIHTKEINPRIWNDDLFVLIFKQNSIYEYAEKFHEYCNGDLNEKKRYRNIISKIIDHSYMIMPSAIPISRIWKSIKIGAEEDFERCLDESRENWALVITMRKGPSTIEFKQPLQDDRVKSLAVAKWKPCHLMIYFGRKHMIDQILEYAGRSRWKALTIENKKLQTRDEFFPLKLCIKLKNPEIFDHLWNLVNMWSIKHLYQAIKEITVPT